MKQKMIFYGVLLFLITSFSACEKNEEIDLNTTQNQTLELTEFIPELPLFVTETQAKEVGINFLNMTMDKEVGVVLSENDIAEFLIVKNNGNQPILYIMNFSNNKGFAVLSASTVEKPVLAYGYEGVFDVDDIENYSGVNDWAAMKFAKINYLINHVDKVDKGVFYQWVVLKPNLDAAIASDPNIFSILEIIPQSFGPLSEPSVSSSLEDLDGYASSAININNIIKEVQSSRVVYLNGCAETKLMSTSTGPNSLNWSISSMSETYHNCHDWVVVGARKVRIKFRVRNGVMHAVFADFLQMDWKWQGNNNGWYDYENWSDVKHTAYNTNYLYTQHIIDSIKP